MAKVDTIELSVDGKSFTYNINVGKDGLFKCTIDWDVSKAIGINTHFECKTLEELKNAILIPYRDYLDSKKTEELFIWIRYKASGAFVYGKDGAPMFDGRSEFYVGGLSSNLACVGFEFGVVIRVTASTGVVTWYEAQKGQGSTRFGQQEDSDPDVYYKKSQEHSVKGKIIPYSDEAIDTLTKAQEGIRKISEILHGVMSQDEKQIEAILFGGRLLNS
jgi:hypothetical protein